MVAGGEQMAFINSACGTLSASLRNRQMSSGWTSLAGCTTGPQYQTRWPFTSPTYTGPLAEFMVSVFWHLLTIVGEFVKYYNEERPHRTLGLDTPLESRRHSLGSIRWTPVLGGLHHTYRRAA